MVKLSEILHERGYVGQFSSGKLEEITDGPKRTLYLGIDPSADSLQVGQLQAFLVLRRFLEDGHKIILLIGGGTGMIGDPGGKNAERPLLDEKTVRSNAKAIASQAKVLFGSGDFTLVDNADWLAKLNLIEFLRDTGKHFSVNAMIQREFIKERLTNVDEGISYTEFSYALLQAYDFFHLHNEYKADVQVGGSDQWGNIISGVDFIRRKNGDTVYALTWPLLINKATGKKFGKSEAGTVWLDPAKTTPFQFYQFWLNVEDENIEEYLLKMTTLSKEEIDAALTEHKQNPGARSGQLLLAHKVTSLVHGEKEAMKAEKVSAVLFGQGGLTPLSSDEVKTLLSSAPSHEIKAGDTLLDVLVGAKLATSKREARQFLEEKAVNLNGEIVTDEKRILSEADFQSGLALLKRGKRNVCVLVLS